MLEIQDEYIENDKIYAPFLLAASFCGFINFIGSTTKEGILYWQFSPKNRAQELIYQFRTKTEPHISSKDLFEAIETFWKQVVEARNEGMKKNGEFQ